MSNPLNKVFEKNKKFPWQTINDETIIIDPDNQNSFELNEVGSFIWKLTDGTRSLLSIQEQIASEYDVEASAISEDLTSVTEALLSNQLIVEKV